MKKAEELYMKHIYATEGQAENNLNPSSEVTINEVQVTQKSGKSPHRPWRNRESSEISPKIEKCQSQPRNPPRTQNEKNRQLPRGSYTHILVNPTQLSDTEFTAWMDRLVEARQNRQENKPRPYRQFRKPFLQNGRELGEVPQDRLRNKLKAVEELNTEELISHMRCELVDIEEAVEMHNFDVEECISA